VCIECGHRFKHVLRPALSEKFWREVLHREPPTNEKRRGWSPCCRAAWKVYVKESTLIRKRFEESNRS
jgi:hypothetical protein